MDESPLAEDYIQLERGGRIALVYREYHEVIADALFDGAGCEPANLGGRGSMQRFNWGDSGGVLRRYRRGGVMRHVARDGYLFDNRPRREFDAHRHAEIAGLPTARLLGVLWERRGPVYRGAIATAYIPGQTLGQYLDDIDLDEDVLAAVGRSIRLMHDAGIWHADLNVHNLIVHDGRVYLIDFDNARITAELSDLQRARNLLRLERSLLKEGHGREAFAYIVRGYGDVQIPMWLAHAYRVKGGVSDAVRGWSDGGGVSYPEDLDFPFDDLVNAAPELLKESDKWETVRHGRIIIKTQRSTGLLHRLTHPLEPARLWRAFRFARYLHESGVPMPMPLTFDWDTKLGITVSSGASYEYLDGCVNVEEFARLLVESEASADNLGRFFEGLADILHKLEAAKGYHRDLSGKNILTRDGDAFYFIDLDSLSPVMRYTQSRRLKNHIQLYDSFCDFVPAESLDEFFRSLVPAQFDTGSWLEKVRRGQRERRSRQRRIWERQGRSESAESTGEGK